ncbi:periplasmic heavy metal sensor [Litoreibacter roseus]|uniref:Heavy-metal resistance protein n=1 Tax=Litoreibacter roseus TaxID=2601869 RepID=A0A6N6JJ19_9RHOB|nr:periplasmic heavy metal sensor [Litoreibacter roseus]GFE65419.1 hypothetical protein KIN_24930 [Litoreibacter roseus]
MSDTRGRSVPLWLKLLLIASLSANLLVVGLFAGARLGGPDRGSERSLRGAGSFAPFVRALDGEDRRAIVRKLREGNSDMRATRQTQRRLTPRILTALRAEPFDPIAFSNLLDQQRSVGDQMRATGQDILVDHLSSMTPQARAAFAERLEGAIRQRRNRVSTD